MSFRSRDQSSGFSVLGVFFDMFFLVPILCDGVWRSLVHMCKVGAVNPDLCAPALSFLYSTDRHVPLNELQERFGGVALKSILRQLYLLGTVTFTKTEPQSIALSESTRRELSELEFL